MSGFVYVGEGKFVMEDSSFVTMYNKLLDDNCALENEYFKIFPLGDKEYHFTFDLEEKNEFCSFISHIGFYGTFISFAGYCYDGENQRKSEIYKMENHDIVVEIENFRQEYQEDADFYLFKEMFQRLETEMINISSSILELQSQERCFSLFNELLDAMAEEETQEQFTNKFIRIIGKENLENDSEITFKSLTYDGIQNINEKITLQIYVSEGEIKFFVNAEFGEFEKSDTTLDWYPIDEQEEFITGGEELKEPAKVYIFKDQPPFLVQIKDAKPYFNEGNTQIKNGDEWVNPCSVCTNRLAKEINGCIWCEFKRL